jgi:hypothetical protein
VGSIAFTEGGFTGGTPGPIGAIGTAASGIVVDHRGSAERTATTVAHEIGHYLGLKHTTLVTYDSEGGRHIAGYDSIGDTPECPPGTSPEDCPDYQNLMFPFYNLGLDLALTPGQNWVTSRNPILYEVLRDRVCALGSVVDATIGSFAAGNTERLEDTTHATCGGQGSPDRIHLYRLETEGLGSLEVTVQPEGFAAVLALYRGACDDAEAEVACETGDAGTEILARLENPSPGWYFIVVDGQEPGGGTYSMRIAEVEP